MRTSTAAPAQWVLPPAVARTGMRVSLGLAVAAVLALPALLLPRGSIWAVLLARRLPEL